MLSPIRSGFKEGNLSPQSHNSEGALHAGVFRQDDLPTEYEEHMHPNTDHVGVGLWKC